MGWPLRRLIGVALVCGLAQAAHAQIPIACESNCRVRVGEPFVAFTETTANVETYRVFLNGAVVSISPTLQNGWVEFRFAQGLPTVGTYTLMIEALLRDGRVLQTDPVSLSVVRRRVRIKS